MIAVSEELATAVFRAIHKPFFIPLFYTQTNHFTTKRSIFACHSADGYVVSLEFVGAALLP